MVREWTIKLLPWIITTAILGYIVATTDLDAALLTLQNANWLGFIPAVIVLCILVFLFDSGCLVLLFRRFNAQVTFKEMLPLKGTSYFLNVINYNAAAAGIALFFRNRKQVPFLEALSSMLWMSFIDIVSLATLMLLGMAMAGDVSISAEYQRILIGLAGFIYLILAGSCIYWNAGFDWVFLGRMRTWKIFTAFSQATLRDYLTFIGLRTAFVTTYVASQWIAMPFFQMEATMQQLFLVVPVLTFVGTIPLTTVAGMGTVQVLMRTLYADFVPATAVDVTAHIDAYSTVTILAFVLCRMGIGYLSMGSVTRDFEAHSERSAAATESVRNSAP